MTLVQLRHLISLAQTGSFSKSAVALFLTQPALSRSIRALENELGHALFDRIGRHSELTPYGREVLERARQLVQGADDLRESGQASARGMAGSLRIGLGSGPGAMLMTPLLMHMATHHVQLQLEISRGRTEMLVRSLRERTLDALVVDARSLTPAPDLRTSASFEMRGSFLCRRGHPLTRKRRGKSNTKSEGICFEQLLAYPIASTPLSDEVARVLVDRYGPNAHPQHCVTLQCEELPSLVELTRSTDTVLIAIRAAGPDLVELMLNPPLNATARFAVVTLAGRSEAPALPIVRDLMQALLHDGKTQQKPS
jgi:DNA-binding transcriptional LysR family regulator